MFGDLQALGMGIIVFAIIIGVGTIVLFNFGGAVGCTWLQPSLNVSMTFNTTAGLCQAPNGSQFAPSGTAYTNVNYVNGQLGQSGLAGWTPAIIAISVGLLFLGAFMMRSGRKGRY